MEDVNWQGSSTGTLQIVVGEATVVLGGLDQVYDGTPKSATATTVPEGLAVVFTYEGSTNAPVACGSYAVTGTVEDVNWQGSSTGTLQIVAGEATVVLGGLAQVYDGTPKSATATTVPERLAVVFTYDGASLPPVGVGSYAVTGTVNDANWQGSATGTLAIGKGTATVSLGHLFQTRDGQPRDVDVTTVPPGLSVDLTYDGLSAAPVSIGLFAVTGTVNEANWQGMAAATLAVGLRINAGGSGVGEWLADEGWVGTNTGVGSTPETILLAGDVPQAVYQTRRWGRTLAYDLDVPDGTYDVRLHFAEWSYAAAGRRVFDVAIEGVPVLADFDPFQAAGGRYRAVCRTLQSVGVSGGMRIEGEASAGDVQFNGIEVWPVGPLATRWDAGYQALGGEWRRLAWWGDYVPLGGDGWIWHAQHGFLHAASGSTPRDVWFYAEDMHWLYTGCAQYPFLYRHGDGAWLWYNGATGPRWFMNFLEDYWEAWP